jgi:hypothetical protein
MLDILVIVGAQLTVLFSIAAMKIYRSRTDVLTGPYIQSAADQSAGADIRVLIGRPQLERPPELGNGVCYSESVPIHKPALVEESPSPNALDMPTIDRISGLTTLAASLGSYQHDILLFQDTAGPKGADDRLEPNSPMASDLKAGTLKVAARLSGQGMIRLDLIGNAPMKIRA